MDMVGMLLQEYLSSAILEPWSGSIKAQVFGGDKNHSSASPESLIIVEL